MSKELVEIDGSLKEGVSKLLSSFLIYVSFFVGWTNSSNCYDTKCSNKDPNSSKKYTFWKKQTWFNGTTFKRSSILLDFNFVHVLFLGLELVNSICNGKLKGGHISSTEIEFWPGKLSGGSFRAAIKTAGSISLLLQVALPCLLYSNAKTTLTLEGGTNAEMAPQIDYTTEVFRPYLEKFGGTFDFDLIKRGYFPKGGGKVVVNVNPVEQLNAIELLDRGTITSIYGWSFVAGTLPLHLAHAMTNAAVSKLKNVFSNVQIETYKEEQKIAPDNGSGIMYGAHNFLNNV